MAYVLPAPAHAPFRRCFTESTYNRTCSSFAEEPTLIGARFHTPRSISATSLVSTASMPVRLIPRSCENTPPRSPSQVSLGLTPPPPQFSQGRSNPVDLELKVKPHSAPDSQAEDYLAGDTPAFGSPGPVCTVIPPDGLDNASEDGEEKEEKNTLVPKGSGREKVDDINMQEFEVGQDNVVRPLPLRRWLSTLRKRSYQHTPRRQISSSERMDSADRGVASRSMSSPEPSSRSRTQHRNSLSQESSLDFITAVRSASITLASFSMAGQSRRSIRSSYQRRINRSSGFSDQRLSLDSLSPPLQTVVDEKIIERAVQRHLVLEELVKSEESYISDLKTLYTTYFTILAGAPHIPGRDSIQRTLIQLQQLHRDLLLDLQSLVPIISRRRALTDSTLNRHRSRHVRWSSADVQSLQLPQVHATKQSFRHSIDIPRTVTQVDDSHGMDTDVVTKVAKIFDTYMIRFFSYEAFVANIEVMRSDALSTSRAITSWSAHERGVEALSKALVPITGRQDDLRKGLTFDDLLIKPIQRICKYALFFNDLCKQTPVYDDPEAHEWLEKIRLRLDDTAGEINHATDNPRTRRCIEITWRLQDRYQFEEHDVKLSRLTVLRALGHVLLCGALHVVFETTERAKGMYMLVALYRSYLVLAYVGKTSNLYHVSAVIPFLDASIEASDNGRGLQCHTALFTWKLAFIHDQRQYEVIMSACSGEEEEAWTGSMRKRILAEAKADNESQRSESPSISFIPKDLRSLGPTWRHSHSDSARRISVQRAATLGPKCDRKQIIIKNTQAQKVGNGLREDLPVMRSQSHLSSNALQMLAPRRAERIRLETLLSDVWTKDVLPFPGMATRRSESAIRASAHTVMRKLSMASLTSNFSRRSVSYTSSSNRTSVSHPKLEDSKPSPLGDFALWSKWDQPSPAVSTHYSDDSKISSLASTGIHRVILPEDFELPVKAEPKRTRYGVFAALAERPKTPNHSTAKLMERPRTATGNGQTCESNAVKEAVSKVIISYDSSPEASCLGPAEIRRKVSETPTPAMQLGSKPMTEQPPASKGRKSSRTRARLASLARFWM